MSVFSFIGDIFRPAADLIDNLHDSDQEMGEIYNKRAELKNKLAEIEAKVSTKMLDLQSQAIEANSKVAVQEQLSGSVLSKNWRPMASSMFVLLLVGMGLDFIEYKPLLAQIAGGFLGIHGISRGAEKKASKS